MSAPVVFIVTFFVYQMFLIWLGWFSVRKEAMTSAQYFQAGKSTGLFVFMFGTLASIFSAWMFIGNPALFAAQGLAAGGWLIHVPLIGLSITLFWNRQYLLLNKHGKFTAPGLLADYYESKTVRLLAGLMAIFYCIPYIVAQMKGAGALVSTLSEGKFSAEWGSYIVALVTLTYLFLGGMKGSAWTAALQGFLLLIGFYFLFAFIVNEAGFFDMFGAIAKDPVRMTLPGPNGTWQWTYNLSYALVTAFGITLSPVYTIWIATCGKGFGKVSRTTGWITWTLISGFTYLFVVVCVGIGGSYLAPDLKVFDNLVPTVMLRYLPVAVYSIVGVAAIAAAQSTAASSLQVGSTSLIEDIAIGVLGMKIPEKNKANYGRFVLVVLLVIAVFVSKYFTAMIAILASLGVSFGLMLVPGWIGMMFWPKISKAGVSAGIIAGAITLTFLYVTKSPLNGFIHFGFSGFLVNVVVNIIVSMFTELPSIDKVRNYQGYLKDRLSPKVSVEKNFNNTEKIY